MDNKQLKQSILKALEDKRYKWRTYKGVAKQIGTTEKKVISIIDNFDNIVKSSRPSIDSSSLFTTRSHFRKTSSILERILTGITGKV